jgi:hypothetical protein
MTDFSGVGWFAALHKAGLVRVVIYPLSRNNIIRDTGRQRAKREICRAPAATE